MDLTVLAARAAELALPGAGALGSKARMRMRRFRIRGRAAGPWIPAAGTGDAPHDGLAGQRWSLLPMDRAAAGRGGAQG